MQILSIFLLYITSSLIRAQKEELSLCCSLGQESDENCDAINTFPNISAQHQTLCSLSAELCCQADRRARRCRLGRAAGRAGRPCVRLAGVGGDAFHNCCLACKLGFVYAGSNANIDENVCNESISNTIFDEEAKSSFSYCCQHMLNRFSKSTNNKNNSRNDDDLNTDDIDNEGVKNRDNSESEDRKCPQGFVYNARLNVCDDLDECVSGSLHSCDPLHELCVNTIGGHVCQSLRVRTGLMGVGEDCAPGFRFFLVNCIDVDECAEGLDNCDNSHDCVNTEGSFKCELKSDVCPGGFEMINGVCQDINECQLGLSDCLESQRCDNTPGSFVCIRYTTCGTGYTLNHVTGECEDDDECVLGTHNCPQPHYKCLNLKGSFRCDKKQCSKGFVLDNNGDCVALKCQVGFEIDDNNRCVDVDECLDNGICGHDLCVNSMGSFNCVAKCGVGLALDPVNGNCEDVDECLEPNACFGANRRCVNSLGSFECVCQSGFVANSNNVCVDRDECRSNPCSGLSTKCINTQGSFSCVCRPGFRMDSNDNCKDIDECSELPNKAGCNHRCINLWGSYRCACQPGFKLRAGNQHFCEDVDECSQFEQICHGICTNTPGAYQCTCPSGYTLSQDKRMCIDVDECLSSPCGSSPSSLCFNIRGGHRCADISCPSDYVRETGNPRRCRQQCNNSRFPNCDKYRPLSISYNFIALLNDLTFNNELGINLFTMQSAHRGRITTRFELQVLNDDVDNNCFRLRRGRASAVLALIKPIPGPKDVHLKLLMKMYHLGAFQAMAEANIFIYVSAYSF